MLAHRLRWWPNIDLALGDCLLFLPGCCSFLCIVGLAPAAAASAAAAAAAAAVFAGYLR